MLRSSLPIITQLERLSMISMEENSCSTSFSSISDLSLGSSRAYTLFLDWTCTLLRAWRSRIKTVIDTLDSETLIELFSTAKLRALFQIFKRFKSDATNSAIRRWSALIFVDRKQETAVLNAILKDAAKRFPDEFGFIRPNFLIGYSTMPNLDEFGSAQHIQPMDTRKQVGEKMKNFSLIKNETIFFSSFRKK